MNVDNSVTILPILSRIEKMALAQHLNHIGVSNFEIVDRGWSTTVIFDEKCWFTLSLKYHNIEKSLVKDLQQYKRHHYQKIVKQLFELDPHLLVVDFNCHCALVLDEPDDV